MKAAAKLLAWFDRNGRTLPWRKTRDPYRILVSEVMLQQTQVSRALVFYPQWLERFPNWKALAKADNASVIRAWSGLGYNRRALMLRDIALQIAVNPRLPPTNYHLPTTESEWRTLKGIGPYTAAALASFSLHERVMPVDTNVRRVLGRFLLGIPFPSPKQDERIRKAADAFLPRRGRFYDVPQALFDLATMVCKKTPDCTSCPMRTVCPAAAKFLSGKVRIPKRSVAKAAESRHRNKPHPDRIYRGRILKLAGRSGGFLLARLGETIDPGYDDALDRAWLAAMVERLVADRLLARTTKTVSLPR
ncbi:A/G-specific adenine glycosylase [Patescibacteria group bacterium]|nr:MAG: A/G-specific adenine glycosylase [Patescibacteria group bacterium]